MKHPLNTAPLSALLVALGACQSPAPLADEAAHTSVIELDRVHWQIGDLDAETVLLLEDGIPAHRTTVTNSNETDRFWTGLSVYRYSAFGSSPILPVHRSTRPASHGLAWSVYHEMKCLRPVGASARSRRKRPRSSFKGTS